MTKDFVTPPAVISWPLGSFQLSDSIKSRFGQSTEHSGCDRYRGGREGSIRITGASQSKVSSNSWLTSVNQNSGFINQRFDNQGSTTKVRQLKTAVSSTKVRQPKSRIRQPRGSSTKKVGFVNQKRRIHQPRFVNQGSSTKNTDSSTKDSSTKRLDSSTKNGGFINQGSSTKNTDSSTKDSSTKRLDFLNQKRRIRQPSFVNQKHGFVNQDFVNQKVGFVQKRRIRRFRNIFSMFGGRKVVGNMGYITGLDMCAVCSEAVHSVAL